MERVSMLAGPLKANTSSPCMHALTSHHHGGQQATPSVPWLQRMRGPADTRRSPPRAPPPRMGMVVKQGPGALERGHGGRAPTHARNTCMHGALPAQLTTLGRTWPG